MYLLYSPECNLFFVISVRLVGVIVTCVIYFIVVPDSALFYLGVLPCFVVVIYV